MIPPGSHVPTEQSRQATCDIRIRELHQGVWSREQQQERRDEMRGKAHTEVTESRNFCDIALKSYQYPTVIRPKANSFTVVLAVLSPFAKALSTPLKWGLSGGLIALKPLGRLICLWALLRLPTAAAAYELETDDVVAGSNMQSTGILFLMAIFTIVTIGGVRDNIQGHRRSLRDRERGFWEKLSHMVWVIAILFAMAMALAISDLNQLTAIDPITEISTFAFVILFAPPIFWMYSKCRRCGRSPCICSDGAGGGGTESLTTSQV